MICFLVLQAAIQATFSTCGHALFKNQGCFGHFLVSIYLPVTELFIKKNTPWHRMNMMEAKSFPKVCKEYKKFVRFSYESNEQPHWKKPESTALEVPLTDKPCVCVHNHFFDALKLQLVLNLGIHPWHHLAVAVSQHFLTHVQPIN